MATKIEWAEETWNPTIGCSRVSAGCDGCYAITQARIRSGNPKMADAYAGLVHRDRGRLDWTGRVNLLPDRLPIPLQRRRPTRFFVDSMSDLFHKDVPESFIAQVWTVMGRCPQHTFIILSKRAGRMRSVVRRIAWRTPTTDERRRGVHGSVAYVQKNEDLNRHLGAPHVLPNVILGVSVEDQHWADVRIPALLDTPAAVRAISAEPLLGPLNLSRYLFAEPSGFPGDWERGLDWVIVGGESGPGARAMHPDWVRGIRDQCIDHDVAFFLKQWGDWGPAPFVVRVCDPAEGWQGTEEELEAAKRDAEARGATHVHTGNPLPGGGYHLHEVGHKPWSL
ncbi:DUF5131 family protein, partial [Actinomadura adrarensis]